MKHLLLVAIVVAAFTSCKKDSVTPVPAEITLTAADISKSLAAGSTINYHVFDGAAVRVPLKAANQSWDFSSLSPMPGMDWSDKFIQASGDYPSAAFASKATAYFATGDQETIEVAYDVTDSGWCRLGAYLPGFTIKIPDYNATIKYPTQTSAYSKRLPFTPPMPMKFGDKVVYDNVKRTENFTINAAAFGLVNTPGAQTYTCNGYAECWASGKIKLPGYSAEMNAVVVKVSRKSVTHYFLGGAPAPASLLSLLGLTDGDFSVNYWYDFYSTNGEGYLGTISVDASNNIYAVYFRKK